jgi:hypothetical protein
LKPFVTEAIFLLLCISFMRVDIAALRDHLRRPGIVVAATAWTMLGAHWPNPARARASPPIPQIHVVIAGVTLAATLPFRRTSGSVGKGGLP